MKILIIDDEESLLKLLTLSIKDADHDVRGCLTGTDGLQSFQSDSFDVVVTDIGLPDIDGLSLLQKFKDEKPEIPVVVITAHGSIESALTAMKRGAYDYIQKPFEPEELKIVIDRAFGDRALRAENTRLRHEVEQTYDFSSILGRSSAMKEVFRRIKKAADTKSTILIQGESGTGKERLSKAIHFNSERKDKALVVVDCSAIPPHLLESELFGHVKGAFTGADRTKTGLCEEADGGTLFLDEIGELPLEMQSKLLRLLQENTIRRVGDTKPIKIDIRVIAATNRDLQKEVKEGRFREDLFYRLNVVPVIAPPLRQRQEDIPILAQHFLTKFAKNYRRPVKGFAPEVLQLFLSYEWPGNIRQLENLVEQLVVMAEGELVQLEDVPHPFRDAKAGLVTLNAEPPPVVADNEWDLKQTLSRIQSYTEEYMIKKALGQTQNNKTKAAQLLGISRRALIYKFQEYKIGEIEESEISEADQEPTENEAS